MDRLVRIFLIALLLSFTGCTHLKRMALETPGKLQVYQDQYVVTGYEFHGEACPYPRSCSQPVLPPGVYNIAATGAYELVSTKLGLLSEPQLIDYDSQTDLCLTPEMQGLVCDPNWEINGVLSNDPDLGKLWGLENPPGTRVASIQTDRKTPDVKVMVLDTGVNCEHEDIECTEIGYNAITGGQTSRDARDDNGHGSHVGGTIAAIGGNGKGISGVSTQSAIVPAKFLAANGSGSLFNAIKAVDFAIRNEVDIINASFGGGGYSHNFQKVINEAAAKGILFIAAAGNSYNDNDSRPHYPSNYDNVISVASINREGDLSYFSNYGVNTVDVAAPGSDIYSVDYRGGYKSLNGTSMATPHVVGVAALIYQKYKHLSRQERRRIAWEAITNTARKEHLDKVKHGVLDGYAAVTGESPPPPNQCKPKTCKKCLKKCGDKHKCACKKWQKCKKECREASNCSIGCR